jgi:hypothetical protein
MPLMKAIQVSSPGGAFELVNKEIPEPQENQVLVKVEACGVCHGDSLVKEGHYPGIQYPRVPGHEVVGRIDKLGSKVFPWEIGQRVGVGWYGGPCLKCNACRRGDLSNCRNSLTTGISFDGGYAEYMAAPMQALTLIPTELNSLETAPLLCAGRIAFSALRNSGAKAGDLVAILVWEVLDIWQYSSPENSVSRRWPCRAARIKKSWLMNWAHMYILIPRLRTQGMNSRNSAGPGLFLPLLPAARLFRKSSMDWALRAN